MFFDIVEKAQDVHHVVEGGCIGSVDGRETPSRRQEYFLESFEIIFGMGVGEPE